MFGQSKLNKKGRKKMLHLYPSNKKYILIIYFRFLSFQLFFQSRHIVHGIKLYIGLVKEVCCLL